MRQNNLFRFCSSLVILVFCVTIYYRTKDGSLISKNPSESRALLSSIPRRNQSHILLMSTARRNHDCIVIENDTVLVNVGGRDINNVEFFNTKTGVQSMFASELVDQNHIMVIWLNNLLYVACGLKGANVNAEAASEHMVVVDLQLKKVHLGPRLRIPRGACASVKIEDFPIKKEKIIRVEQIVSNEKFAQLPASWREDVICLLGGSVGSHDQGKIVTDFDCFSPKAGGWIVMPDLPLPLDHLNGNKLKQIKSNGVIEEVIIIDGGRSANYANESTAVFSFSLRSKIWKKLLTTTLARSAGTSNIAFNQYLLVFGGVEYKNSNDGKQRQSKILKEIEICDLHQMVCRVIKQHLATQRFAVRSCISEDQEAVYVCGGTSHGVNNLKDCEVFNPRELIHMAFKSD